MLSNIVPSHIGSLSLQQALELTNVYLENAYRTRDPDVALVLCHDAEVALSQAKKASKKHGTHTNDTKYRELQQGVATAFIDLGKYLERRGYQSESVAICKKAEKWGGNVHSPGRLAQLSPLGAVQPSHDTPPPPLAEISHGTGPVRASVGKTLYRPKIAIVPAHIFAENVRPPAVEYKLPQPDERLSNTPQLVCCLGLLQASRSPDDVLEPVAFEWLQVVQRDSDEQERLHTLSIEVIRAFKRDELKDAKAVAEVVWLAPVLDKGTFNDLLREFYSGIDHSGLLNFHHLEGLAQLIQGADLGHLSADDLVKILELLSARLKDTHKQSTHHMYQLTLAMSHVLDAMADTKVTGLDRKNLHEPLSSYLSGLMKSTDPFLVYQAAYAYQAFLCVPDNETTWQAAMRRTGKVVQGVAGLVSAVKGLDLDKFIEGLTNIQQGVEGLSKVIEVARTGYDSVKSLAQGGQGFVECLKEGLSFERRREWYAALRGADTLIRDGELATFKKLVCGAPCRYDAAFQWGVCQRLGEMATNPAWDAVTRRGAIAFLGEIYRDDVMWGQQASVKQWILNILMQLSSTGPSGKSGGSLQLHAIVAGSLLQELETCDDAKKLELYRACRANGPVAYPLKTALPELASPSLLDRVQNRPDVEGNIRVLRKQRTKERGDAVYIPPQAKPNFQAPDDARFPLMERVKQFTESDQKVFLLLGDSGAGKSTFNRELEFEMWKAYENKSGRIPLHINLPAIEKPEHDMIAKHLRKAEFTEPQIREMKHHRKFILICDGYDESQQTQNLYMTNKLNEKGEWDAQMVISCRSEYLGVDYRDRFQPGGDRNTRSDSLLFQEALIAPFTMDQVQAYIQQYVTIHQPLWRTEDYKQALELIPSLKDLVKNPFLMTLSLDVLPRMVDPGQHLSSTQVTRVELYDHFVEQWLERGKKRLGEKDMIPQTKVAFERLSAGGFTLNGIEYLKKIAVAVFKEQGGNPVIEYAPMIDEGSWKDDFFKEEHKQLLLEASPLTRNGNQYRFIHRSLLEYGLTRAVYDPQDRRNRGSSEPVLARRGSTSSNLSFEMEEISFKESGSTEQDPDPKSPLMWRNFANDHSLLHFLEERVQQEPVFKQQLLAYIEYSKSDKRWRKAAANAMTILVRSGVHFQGTDLRGIQIPGADLSYGMFDSVQLQGADLRKADLRGVWMRQTDLSDAQMEGVQFGELPYLSEDNRVWSCAYSPDGALFAVGLSRGTINVYSTSNWEKIMTLNHNTVMILHLVFSPDGNQIASTSPDATARLWDVRTGTCQYILITALHVGCVAYSPRDNAIAIASKELKIRDVETGECLRLLSGHTGMVLCATYSPLGDKIATSGEDCTVRLWDVDTGACSHIMIGHVMRVWSIAFSPSGDQLASASLDRTARLWDTGTGNCRHELAGYNGVVNTIAYSPKGGQVVSGDDSGAVRVWDVETGVNHHTFSGHRGSVMSVSYSPQGNHIASGCWDKTVRVWDVSSGASRLTSCIGAGSPRFTLSPDGNQFATFRLENTIRLWDVETGASRMNLRGHSTNVICVTYSLQMDKIASLDADGSVLLWNLESGTYRHLFTVELGLFSDPYLAFSPQGHMIAVCYEDMTVELWDVATGLCNAILIGRDYFAAGIGFSPTGELIASASWTGILQVWDIESMTCRHALVCDVALETNIIFSPQGHQLAVSDRDAIHIWDTKTGECQMVLVGHTDQTPIRIKYSHSGDTLISCGGDTLRIWDTASGQCKAVFRGLPTTVHGIIQKTDSDDICLITGSKDGSIGAWRVINKGPDEYQLSLKWVKTSGALTVTGASIQGVRGLSPLNEQLLKQRGAEGTPKIQLREASKRILSMASVVSKLRQQAGRTMTDGSSNVDLPDTNVERPIQPTDEL